MASQLPSSSQKAKSTSQKVAIATSSSSQLHWSISPIASRPRFDNRGICSFSIRPSHPSMIPSIALIVPSIPSSQPKPSPTLKPSRPLCRQQSWDGGCVDPSAAKFQWSSGAEWGGQKWRVQCIWRYFGHRQWRRLVGRVGSPSNEEKLNVWVSLCDKWS